MIYVAVSILGAALILSVVLLRRGLEAERRDTASLNLCVEELRRDNAELAEKLKAADELIEAAKEREEEAARSERLFQDGLASIVNYDYMTATKGKNGNGER